jgi:hypothetical protein
MAGFELLHDPKEIDDMFDFEFDEIAESALKEAAPILKASLESALSTSVEHEGDSELVKSVKCPSPRKSKNGAWILNCGPSGYSKTKVYHHTKTKRTYPVSNALKAIWKEYGIAGRQPARPFLAKATNDAKESVYEVIQKNFDEKTGAK